MQTNPLHAQALFHFTAGSHGEFTTFSDAGENERLPLYDQKASANERGRHDRGTPSLIWHLSPSLIACHLPVFF